MNAQFPPQGPPRSAGSKAQAQTEVMNASTFAAPPTPFGAHPAASAQPAAQGQYWQQPPASRQPPSAQPPMAQAHAYPAQPHMAQPQACPAQAPPGAPGVAISAPPQAPRRRSRAPLVIGLGVGALALGGLVAGGVVLFGKKAVLPCDLENLPKETTSVDARSLDASIAQKLGVKKGEAPKQATWSLLADKVCGGGDLFGSLMAGEGESVARALAEKDRARGALECGRALSDGFGQYAVVRFGDGADEHRVGVMRSSLDAYPPDAKGVKKASSRGRLVEVRCFVDDAKTECEDKSRGVGHIEDSKLWIHGSIADMEAFAKAYSREGKSPPKGHEVYASLLSKLGGYDDIELGRMKDFDSQDLDGGTFASGATERKALDEQWKSLGGHWARGMKGDDSARVERTVLVFDKESNAKEIEGLLKAFKKDVLAAMARQKEMLDKGKAAAKPATPEAREAVDRGWALMEMRATAYADATIERDGTSVVFNFEMKAHDALRELLDARAKSQKKKLEAAAKIVDAVLEGDPAPKDALAELGGDDFVASASAPPKGDSAPKLSAPPPSAPGVLVPGTGGFMVPSGATPREIPLDAGRVGYEYVFPGSSDAAVDEFIRVTMQSGYDCNPDSSGKLKIMVCTKSGSKTVRMLFGKDESSRFFVSVLP